MDNTSRTSLRFPWISLIIGILSIAVGVLCFVWPAASLATMSILLIACMLGFGVGNIISALANRRTDIHFGWDLTRGIIELALGIWLLFMPGAQVVEVLVYAFAFWIMFSAVSGISQSIFLSRMHASGWVWMLILSILALIASFFILLSPVLSGIALLTFAGIGFITFGLFRFMLPFVAR